VVVLTTSKTTTTGVLAVLSDTSLTGGNVTAAELQVSPSQVRYNIVYLVGFESSRRQRAIIVSSSGLFLIP
jgi:hypothetical protein